MDISISHTKEFPSDNKEDEKLKEYHTHLQHSMFEYHKRVARQS